MTPASRNLTIRELIRALEREGFRRLSGGGNHRGVIALFDSEFVKPGLFPGTTGDSLKELFMERMKDDYDRMGPVEPEEADRALVLARDFIRKVKEFLISRGFDLWKISEYHDHWENRMARKIKQGESIGRGCRTASMIE